MLDPFSHVLYISYGIGRVSKLARYMRLSISNLISQASVAGPSFKKLDGRLFYQLSMSTMTSNCRGQIQDV